MNTFTFTDDELLIIKMALSDRRMMMLDQSGINPINRDSRLLPINALIRKIHKPKENEGDL